ncbi:MAG: biotin--[acetyl-CoA-carboxylase] ligase [Candidatus Cloacimonadota bacterium]|nr:biotin--[acetyl-CoA-carboxylase] ligase [Candidatus Cloacimonadota bacterium]
MKSKFFPVIKFYPILDSTNVFAKKLLKQKSKKNFVIVAREQKDGKGRLGRKWASSKGGLWFTMVLAGKQYQSNVTLLTSIALHKTIKSIFSSAPLFIKWPNDLFWKDKKIAGILTSSSQNSTIIGVGLNVNQKQMPKELEKIATTLYMETSKKIKLKKILKHFLQIFANDLKLYKKNGFEHFQNYYNDYNYLFGKKIKVELGNEELRGEVTGVSPKGELLVNVLGKVKKIISAEKIDIISPH